jgi:hypothetical protein
VESALGKSAISNIWAYSYSTLDMCLDKKNKEVNKRPVHVLQAWMNELLKKHGSQKKVLQA